MMLYDSHLLESDSTYFRYYGKQMLCPQLSIRYEGVGMTGISLHKFR